MRRKEQNRHLWKKNSDLPRCFHSSDSVELRDVDSKFCLENASARFAGLIYDPTGLVPNRLLLVQTSPFSIVPSLVLGLIHIRVEHRNTARNAFRYIPIRSDQGGRRDAETSLLRCRCLSPAKAKEPLPTIATSIWRKHKHEYESVFQEALTRISEH